MMIWPHELWTAYHTSYAMRDENKDIYMTKCGGMEDEELEWFQPHETWLTRYHKLFTCIDLGTMEGWGY